MAHFGRIFSCGSSPDSGVWWVGLSNARLFLKAPRYEPLFDERYGYYGFRIPLGKGWRIIGRTVRRINIQ